MLAKQTISTKRKNIYIICLLLSISIYGFMYAYRNTPLHKWSLRGHILLATENHEICEVCTITEYYRRPSKGCSILQIQRTKQKPYTISSHTLYSVEQRLALRDNLVLIYPLSSFQSFSNACHQLNTENWDHVLD